MLRAAAVVAVVAACAGPSTSGVAQQPRTPAMPAAGVTSAAGTPATAAPRAAATQLVRVRASRYGVTTATVTAYDRRGSRWVRVLGPWTAYVGSHGVARPGAKREGDGRTPSGTYGFGSFFFGVSARPSGIRYAWRPANRYDVWDDDPASARYNLWTDTRRQSAGRDPEPLHVSPAYDYAAVIAYNTARRPGLGSAIFLHVSHGSPTAGCVSLPRTRLLRVLRWLDPRKAPQITIGVG